MMNVDTNRYKCDGVVYHTHDYSIFKILDGNRSVPSTRVNKVKESIAAVGYLQIPIVVNQNMEIIDGQARLSAFSDLGLPIYYVIINNAGLKQCQALNTYGTKWTVKDYIISYAKGGNQNYSRLLDVMNKYNNIPISLICEACEVAHIGSYNKLIETGMLNFPEVSNIKHARLDWLSHISIAIKNTGFRKDNTMVLLCKLSKLGLINEMRMLDQFNKHGFNFDSVASAHSLEELQRLYNHHQTKRYYFADKYRESRYS